MATYLRLHGVRLFDYPHFAEPRREEIRQNAEPIAQGQLRPLGNPTALDEFS